DLELQSSRTASMTALLTSSSTLICCALPAMLVAVGAGAALSSLITTVPQLVWFSEHKTAVFCTAGIMLLLSGILQWRSRRLPCRSEPTLAHAGNRPHPR